MSIGSRTPIKLVKSPIDDDMHISLTSGQDIVAHNNDLLTPLRESDGLPGLQEILDGLWFNLFTLADNYAWKQFREFDVCIKKISDEEHKNFNALVGVGYVDHILNLRGTLIPKAYAHFSLMNLHFIILRADGCYVRNNRFTETFLIEEGRFQDICISQECTSQANAMESMSLIFRQDAEW